VQAWLLVAVLTAACGTPPNKEMDQAQGAIDAARAAGADRYAAQEFEGATASLQAAHDAVAQRDYRLALNHALESRERAQNAAREAADTRARLRGEVERAMAEVDALLAQARMRVDAAAGARVPRRTIADLRDTLAGVDDDVQEARAGIQAEEYTQAQAALAGLKTRIEEVLARLETASPGRPR
jgi:hypothetical protein